MKGKLRTMDELTSDPGERLPPADSHDTTWLFTCCLCGRRWADPPSVVVACGCGSEQVVGHEFTDTEYRNLRFTRSVSTTDRTEVDR